MEDISKINFHIELKFFGAVGNITTGSSTLITICRGNDRFGILVDYGLFQGKDEHYNELSQVIYEKIDAVIITHAHLDHCGLLPYLYKHGYSGKTYCTREASEHIKNVLHDVAEINKQKIQHQLKAINKIATKSKNKQGKKKQPNIAADFVDELKESVIYLPEDVDDTIHHLSPLPVNQLINLYYGVSIKLIPSSHQDGAAIIEIYANYKEQNINFAFSGDIGKADTYLYRKMGYKPNNKIHYLVMECLHGIEEEIEDYKCSYDRLRHIIKEATQKKKNIYIATFALDRSATIIAMLNQMMDEHIWLNVSLDSPLANKHLANYICHYQSKTSSWFKQFKKNPFFIGRINLINNRTERISKKTEKDIIVTTSAMGYAGPIRDYFKEHIEDEDAIFIFTGWLPPESPSSILHETAKRDKVTINGNEYVKLCETARLHGLSGHGYYDDLISMINRYPKLKAVFLNHAEHNTKLKFKECIEKERPCVKILIPKMNEKYNITMSSVD